MRLHDPRPSGLRPTLRQLMIFILATALLIAAFRAMWRGGYLGNDTRSTCSGVAIFFAAYPMLLLGVLLLGLDRRGPVRTWYFACCWTGMSFISGASFLISDLASYLVSGQRPLIFPVSPILGVVCLWAGSKQLQAVWPRLCPSCGCRAVMAVARPLRPDQPKGQLTGQECWCATCGARFEKDATPGWQPTTKSKG